jgi:hypothetical protein
MYIHTAADTCDAKVVASEHELVASENELVASKAQILKRSPYSVYMEN